MVNKPLIRPCFLGGVALGGAARIPLILAIRISLGENMRRILFFNGEIIFKETSNVVPGCWRESPHCWPESPHQKKTQLPWISVNLPIVVKCNVSFPPHVFA